MITVISNLICLHVLVLSVQQRKHSGVFLFFLMAGCVIAAPSYPAHNCLTVQSAIERGGSGRLGTRPLAHVAQLFSPYVAIALYLKGLWCINEKGFSQLQSTVRGFEWDADVLLPFVEPS